MGAAASNTYKTGNANMDRTIQKMAVLGALRSSGGDARLVKPKPKPTGALKENIYDFVAKQKQAREETRLALEGEHRGDRSMSMLPDDDRDQDTGENSLTRHGSNIQQEEDKTTRNYCGLCNRVTRVTIDGWPCRVCGQTYHKSCVSKCRRYSAQDIQMFDRANTQIGWSCEHCDNILNLLEPHEVDKLANDFELLDKNKDCSVCLEEFLMFKRREWERDEKRPMPAEEEHYHRLQFKQLDTDGNGDVDYWEFVKNEGCKCLARRSKEDLVKLLTPYETTSAKNVYDMLDVDKNGVLTERETRVTLRGWYHLVGQANDTIHGRSVKRYTAAGTMDVMPDADEDGDRILTWREFLRSQALYILSSRPNKVNIK